MAWQLRRPDAAPNRDPWVTASLVGPPQPRIGRARPRLPRRHRAAALSRLVRDFVVQIVIIVIVIVVIVVIVIVFNEFIVI